MATIDGINNTTPGIINSFTKTPQAGDDNYLWTEDALLSSNLFNKTTNIVTLDVMSNDLGGKAKTLFSIDDGGDGSSLTDLLNKETGWESTANGNEIRIINGKIELNITNELNDKYGGNIDSLAAGESITDSFRYTIQLGNGT